MTRSGKRCHHEGKSTILMVGLTPRSIRPAGAVASAPPPRFIVSVKFRFGYGHPFRTLRDCMAENTGRFPLAVHRLLGVGWRGDKPRGGRWRYREANFQRECGASSCLEYYTALTYATNIILRLSCSWFEGNQESSSLPWPPFRSVASGPRTGGSCLRLDRVHRCKSSRAMFRARYR